MTSRITSPSITAQLSTNSDFELRPNPVFCGQSRVGNSRTWSYASGGLENLDVVDGIDDRSIFVDEYNRLAQKLGIRLLIPEDNAKRMVNQQDESPRRTSWFSRKFKRQPSAQSPISTADTTVRRKRSIGDVAMQMVHSNRNSLKNEDLQGLIQLCGKSFLYLPSEYAPCPLILPTSLRASAHYLIQHAITTPGIFRIPGSIRIVNEIYDYYSTERHGDEVTGTVRNPNLPSHIKVSVHDVASVFKKFLSGLPGGILGSLSLFDALVAIESQLHGSSDFERNRRDLLRARLIALAVGTVRSQFRRELICAVFGMLCLLGQQAQTEACADGQVASEMMGYNAFGIVFGPLLAGDLLDSYTMKLSDHSSGLVLSLNTPPAVRKHRKKSSGGAEPSPGVLTVNKIRVANDVTEMLITHWLEVVKNMKSLNILRSDSWAPKSTQEKADNILKTSDSDPFVRRKPLKTYSAVSNQAVRNNLPSYTNPALRINGNTLNGVGGTPSRLPMKRIRPNSYSLASAPAPVPAPKNSMFLLSPMAKEPSHKSPSTISRHTIGYPVGATNIFDSTPSPKITNTLRNESPQSPEKDSVDLPPRPSTKPGTGGRGSVQSTPQSLIGTQASLNGQVENIDRRRVDRHKVSDTGHPMTKSPRFEEQSMDWLGDYLNLEEASRTPIKLGNNGHDALASAFRGSFVTPYKEDIRGANSSETKKPLSKTHFDMNEGNTGLDAHNSFRSYSPDKSNAEIQKGLGFPRQTLSRARSKTISTPPVTPWRLQSSITTDRKHARKSIGGAVKAMAAMFDNAAKDSSIIPTPSGKARVRRSSKIFNGLSTYTVNPSPAVSNSSNRSYMSHLTPNKPKQVSQGPQQGLFGGKGQHETPTRRPLRSLVGDNTDALAVAQTPPENSSLVAGGSLTKPQAKPPKPSDQLQVHHVEHPTAQLSEHGIPRLVSGESQVTGTKFRTAPRETLDPATYRLKDLKQKLLAKEQECKGLKVAMGARDHDIASLKDELTRSKTNSNVWQRRAETAERRVEAFVSRATKIKEISRSSADKDVHFRAGLNLGGSPHRVERSSSSACSRDGDGTGASRMSCTSGTAVEASGMDCLQQATLSEWSGGTVVQTTPNNSQTLLMAVDELLQLATGTTTDMGYLYGPWP